MRTSLIALLPLLPLLASPAMGQNLSDRLAAVQQQRDQQAQKSSGKPALLGALLHQKLSCDFNDTPARDAFEYLESVLGVPLVVRYDSDRNANGSGIDPDAEVTLTLSQEQALRVLETLIAQVQDLQPCTWQLRDGFIEVGTKERLSVPAAQELRIYPVRDLLFDVPYFDNAPDFNLNSSIQQGNTGGGGAGGGGGGAGGGGGFGGGGGGGGFGGGGGGSGGGGGGSGGGGIFGDPGEEPERATEEEKVQQLVDIILETVEPEAWVDNGGDAATIRFYQGVLIIKAPDYIQRQIGGYNFAPRPPVRAAAGRYVDMNVSLGIAENVQFRQQTVTGAAGGNRTR